MRIRKTLRILFVTVFLAGWLCQAALPCVAASMQLTEQDVAGKTPEGLVASFMDTYGLDESNFSLCYYNTVTGEEYCFNEDHFMIAASTFKLPLNMYYYEMEFSGELDPSTWAVTASSLATCHYESIVNSNNELSMAMLYHLGDFRTYKEKMRKYFTMPEENIEPVYYYDNYYCTHMMMDALKYLYEHSDDFSEMVDYMKQALPGCYFKEYVTDYEIAHKYGDFGGAHNDVGIIYTEQPFLLAVYTQNVGPEVCANAAELMTAYTEHQIAMQKAEEAAQAEKEAAMKAEQERLAQEQAEQEAEKARQEELAREQAEQEAAMKAEQERLAQEQAERLAEQEAAEKQAQEQALQQEQARQEAENTAWHTRLALGCAGAMSLLSGVLLLFGRKKKPKGRFTKPRKSEPV